MDVGTPNDTLHVTSVGATVNITLLTAVQKYAVSNLLKYSCISDSEVVNISWCIQVKIGKFQLLVIVCKLYEFH